MKSPTPPHFFFQSSFDSRMWRLEEQKTRYGAYLYIRDEGGYFTCFYRNCGQKLKEDIGGHIEGHEQRNEEIDDDYRKATLVKYRNRPEAASSNALRVKSSLRRSKEAEISLTKCAGILEILCALCDSVPLTITPAQENAICERREGCDWTLANLVFEPLRARGWSLVSTKQALDLGVVYRKLQATGDAGYKDAEDFAMDVRHALNYMRMAAGNATVFAAIGGREFQAYLQRLSTEFAFQMEFERLNQRFDNAEKRIESTFGAIELPYSVLIEVLGSLLSSPHSSVLERPDSSNYTCAYLSELLPQYYHSVMPLNSVLEVYEQLRQGNLCGAPFFHFSRLLRSYFHHILLWNEHQNEAYPHVDKMAILFETLLEKAAQDALRDSHRNSRYSARDQHSQLLIWDPKVKQYYLEYFSSPTTEWQEAKTERKKYEDQKAAETGSWGPEQAPSNSAKHFAEATGASTRVKGGIERFATAPSPEVVPSFVSATTASTLLSTPSGSASSASNDLHWNAGSSSSHMNTSNHSSQSLRSMPGAVPMHHPIPSHQYHQQQHQSNHSSAHQAGHHQHNVASPTPNRTHQMSPSMAPIRSPTYVSLPNTAPNVSNTSHVAATSTASLMGLGNNAGPSLAPSNSFATRGPSPAPSAAPIIRTPSQNVINFHQNPPHGYQRQ